MEYVGWIALLLMLLYCSYPGRVRRLEKKVRKLESYYTGGNTMSKLIESLKGKKCKLTMDETLFSTGSNIIIADIQDSDEEWVKFSYTDKKNGNKTKIVRIDSISSIELIEEL